MRASFRAVLAASVLWSIPATAWGQLISLRTVPIARADRLDPLPSYNLGLAGVSIALADSLFDVTVNPAKGVRLSGARFVAFPVAYTVSENTGGGRALPVGAVATSGTLFGGFSVALQGVDGAQPETDPFLLTLAERGAAIRPTFNFADSPESHGNASAFAMLGKAWPGTGLSVGGSVAWTRHSAMDGTDLLYDGSRAVDQFGYASDFRLGMLKELPGSDAIEVLVLHARSRMTHDVIFLDPIWDPATQETLVRARAEHNRDHTHTWGLHVAYERPLGGDGWRIGWLGTANRVLQPAVPDYRLTGNDVLSVPWAPGDAWAYNVGVGVGRTHGSARVGMDLIFEPIWSHTESETVENEFRFANLLVRMGVGDEIPMGRTSAFGFQVGLGVRWMHYWLDQYDEVQAAGVRDEKGWVEWTPAFGFSLRVPSWMIRYQASAMQGTRRSGVFGSGFGIAEATRSSVWPGTGSGGFGPVSVLTHQVSVSVPLGRLGSAGGER